LRSKYNLTLTVVRKKYNGRGLFGKPCRTALGTLSALTPFMLIARLALGLAAFISSIASAVIGLTVGLFAVLSVIELAIGYWQNGIAFMVLALLASPIGLPAIANFLLNRIDRILGFFEGLLC